MLRRIVITGCSGSGKSTLARQLGQRLGLPVVHLDVLFWCPGWKERDTDDFRARVTQAHAGNAWISEGNYITKTFDLRLPRAAITSNPWSRTPSSPTTAMRRRRMALPNSTRWL